MQNDVLRQIQAKEEEIEKRVRDATAEAADRLRQLAVENELRRKNVREKLQEDRQIQVQQTESMMMEQEQMVLDAARKEAETLRRDAVNRMSAAVTLVKEAVLRKA